MQPPLNSFWDMTFRVITQSSWGRLAVADWVPPTATHSPGSCEENLVSAVRGVKRRPKNSFEALSFEGISNFLAIITFPDYRS